MIDVLHGINQLQVAFGIIGNIKVHIFGLYLDFGFMTFYALLGEFKIDRVDLAHSTV